MSGKRPRVVAGSHEPRRARSVKRGGDRPPSVAVATRATAMTRVSVCRTIPAPAARVFRIIADVERLPDHFPEVIRVEMLNETRGAGCRFVETRQHRGKQMRTELEMTEYEPDRRVRMVADSHGTVWDTCFDLDPSGDATRLTVTMHARAHSILPRILNPMMKRLFRRGIRGHLEAVARVCTTPHSADAKRPVQR
ncbi:MAG: SRPBCC family protein [Myxococcales bacterium FL481]|nr:MAG: SRPBCC family protein [Myxococcales bacterium FL481]